ncbi:MAG: hypothetical protein JSS93_15130, partial [Bacteroidetes bacterium]|nr:hypothetical protein [Bacteroidota bacterium]
MMNLFSTHNICQNKLFHVLGLVMVFFFVKTTYAQPKATYNLKYGGASITILGKAPKPQAGVPCTAMDVDWTVNSFTGTYSYTSTACGSGCQLNGSAPQISVAPQTVGNTQTLSYYTKTLTVSYVDCTSGGSGLSTMTINAITYADLSSTGTLPATVCSNGSIIDLSTYINLNSTLKSAVTYYMDGNPVSNPLSPASISAGSHTITASYPFDNGTTTITVGTFTLVMAVSAVSSPVAQTICQGGTATFSASASGTGLTYQWQESVNAGVSWNIISTGGVYGGATSTSLSITSPGVGFNGRLYRCYINDQNSCNPSYTSNAILTVNTNVGIATQPAPATSLCPGQAYNLSVVASGTAPYSYQWYKGG